MIRLMFSILCFCVTSESIAQKLSSSDPFLNHLYNQDLEDDALFYLNNRLSDDSCTLEKDSIHFLLASLYQKRDLELSILHYEAISDKESALLPMKKIALILNYLEADRIEQIENVLQIPSSSIWSQSCDSLYLLTSIDVLQQEYRLNHTDMCSSESWNELSLNAELLEKRGKKSAFVAGSLSALVPGLGKVYVGKTGQGVMAFVTSVVLGWQAYEGYQKGGINDTRFIVFTSLFGINYVGNIWGSALSVHVNYKNQYYESKDSILATIKLFF